MKKLLIIPTLLCFLLSTPSVSYADPSPWTNNATYLDKAFGKFEFGLLNFLGGWSEILTRPARYSEDDKNFFVGIGHGFLNGLIFTAGGAAHLVTFPVPIDIPLPEGGVASDSGF